MDKPANNLFEIHPLLKKRYSPRAFSSKVVEQEKLDSILEAARWAPSASNIQPWRFAIGKKGDTTYNHIFNSLVEFNRIWCNEVPVLLVFAGNTVNPKTGNINKWWQYDCGQAAAHLSIEATHQGLFVHQMGGFDTDQIKANLNFPPDFDPITIIAIGYSGDYKLLPEKLIQMELAERVRIGMEDLILA
jgi:nitroreductase